MSPKGDDWRGSLRLPREAYEAIVQSCSKRVGVVSVNTWILEAVTEKLETEAEASKKASGSRHEIS